MFLGGIIAWEEESVKKKTLRKRLFPEGFLLQETT